MKIEFSSQRREMLFFVTANIAAVTSRANQQYKAPGKTAFENLSPRACLRNSFFEVALGESVADVHYKILAVFTAERCLL